MNDNIDKPETAYDIIARILQLSHSHDNIYKDKEGKSFVLNKYGFQPSVLMRVVSSSEEEIIRKGMVTEIQALNKKVAKLQKKITELENGVDKNAIDNAVRNELITKANRKRLLEIVSSTRKTEKEKLNEIIDYIGNNWYKKLD